MIRFELPADGYMNPLNTVLAFDLILTDYASPSTNYQRFQNNIQSVFTRGRITYGSTPLEDLVNYNVIVRMLTEHTATNQLGTMDQTSISEGIGGVTVGVGSTFLSGSGIALGSNSGASPYVNVRQAYLEGIDHTSAGLGFVPNQTANGGTQPFRRYVVNFAFGLFTQDKLIPLKFLGSAFIIELYLSTPDACIFSQVHGATGAAPTYQIQNPVMIVESLQFDSSYDASFLKGITSGGVPIKYASWHTFTSTIGNQTNISMIVQERSRSVKALFAVQRRMPETIFTDSHAMVFSSATNANPQSYQWVIGMRYFPAAPVQMASTLSSSFSNGAAEAFLEMQKALNIVGDYRLSTSVNVLRWAMPYVTITTDGTNPIALGESDYTCFTGGFSASGNPTAFPAIAPGAGNVGSTAFAMAIDLETSNGIEISGLNAEEQSDIRLNVIYAASQASGYVMEVYSLFDALLIIRENNEIELVQ
jgi:hypothetical protein